jgi:nitroreductase
MEKPAQLEYPVIDVIARRWSPRAFDARPIEPEKLHSLFEAARWAPSSSNEQPWSFVYATKENSAQFNALVSCLVDANQRWAKDAPVLMCSIASLTFVRHGKPNRHALHDTGMAMANLLAQATSLNIFVHQMAGFDMNKAREVLAIPETHDPVAFAAIGYAGDETKLPDDLRQREVAARERKPQSAFVFKGKFNARA